MISKFVTAALVLLIAVLTGCAGGLQRGASLDAERVNRAILTNDVAFLNDSIRNGAMTPDTRIATPGYPDGAPLIAIAARSASLESLRFLIASGADVNARTPVGETPLMLAAFFFNEDERGPQAFEKHERAVRMLVDAGAELENWRYHYTPLAYAAYRGNDRLVRFLVERGARANADAEDGLTYVNTPLMMAAIQGHQTVADYLIRAGADPKVRVINGGSTAAEFAAKYNHSQVYQMLRCAERAPLSAATVPSC